jgi:exonuclease III
MKVLSIDCFRLVSNFSRNHSPSGVSCIFIRNNIETKEAEYLTGLGKEQIFEIAAVELPDIDTIVACIYRSPDSDFYEFLHKLELLILKVSSKGKRLILCGDLNVNFIQHSGKLLDFQNLLLMNSLINVVKSPTRISNHFTSLIDVIIVNNIKNEL